jgi:preprotein translocase subunit SecB
MEPNFSIAQIKLLASHFEMSTASIPNESKNIDITTNISVDHKKQKGNLVGVTMTVISDGNEQPFTFTVVYEGTFRFSKMPSKEDLHRIVGINCAAIMLPYIRESVADLTRRASIPPFHMDPVNFVSAYKEMQARQSDGKSKEE